MRLKIKTKIEAVLLSETAKLPTYGSEHAAGADLYADLPDGTIYIQSGERALIPTNVALAIPSAFYGQIHDRSGLAYKNGMTTLAGVIDADYRGPIGVVLHNTGNGVFKVGHHDRVAQLVVLPYATADFELVEILDFTVREAGGFGSTGV